MWTCDWTASCRILMIRHDHKQSAVSVCFFFTGGNRTSCVPSRPSSHPFLTAPISEISHVLLLLSPPKIVSPFPPPLSISPLPLRVLLTPLSHFICFFPSHVPSLFPYFSFPRSLHLIFPLPSRPALSPSMYLLYISLSSSLFPCFSYPSLPPTSSLSCCFLFLIAV